MFGVNTVNKKLSNNISCIWAKILKSPLKDKQIIWGFYNNKIMSIFIRYE